MRDLSYPLSRDDLRTLVAAAVPAPAGTHDVASRGSSSVVAIGAFDGVHRGHRELIACCVRDARAHGMSSVVVTFDPDPSELLARERADRRLLSVADRVSFCWSLGVDDVLIMPFTAELAALTPAAFVQMLKDQLGDISLIHVGTNFHFGVRGSGDAATLKELGSTSGFAVEAHPLLRAGEEPVSSTRIRTLLAAGRVAEAAQLLGRYHFVRGIVDHGRGEGTAFGFPTANVRCDPRTCMPCEGVYACVVTDGTHAWPAAVNVGKPPTFDTQRDACFLEANLIGFSGDLYGSELAVIFVEWLRASRPFSSLEELERVVLGNIDWVRQNVGDACVEVDR